MVIPQSWKIRGRGPALFWCYNQEYVAELCPCRTSFPEPTTHEDNSEPRRADPAGHGRGVVARRRRCRPPPSSCTKGSSWPPSTASGPPTDSRPAEAAYRRGGVYAAHGDFAGAIAAYDVAIRPTRATPTPTRTAATAGGPSAISTGHRRLQCGHRAETMLGAGLQEPRQCPLLPEGLLGCDRRLRPGNRAQPSLCRRV